MKPIKIAFWATLASVSLLWLITDTTSFASLQGVFAWRNVLAQYSGILAISFMSLAIILAVRPTVFEPYLGGLDKMYRLHKWLGIGALAVSIGHWLIIKAPKWAVGWGWLTRGARKPRPVLPEGTLQHWLADQRGLAEGIGEWAFYLAALLMALALIRHFPYRRFFQTHRILALTYLALVFHAVVLTHFDYWRGPVGGLLMLLMGLGTPAALLSLFRRRVGAKSVPGTIAGLEWQPSLQVLAVDIVLVGDWPGHQAGQFGFATFHADEGPHPFTLASAWENDGRVRFLIKGLGDYTRSLPERLKVGDAVILEGPYGRFTFEGESRRQIWISGGIGITPFIARMRALASAGDGRSIDLFHCTPDLPPDIAERLTSDAQAANIRLHIYRDQRQERFALSELQAQVPAWQEADIWFCGPAGFGQQLRTALTRLGLPSGRFHQELFQMR